MVHEEGVLAENGAQLYTQSWLPATRPRAVIALVHGVTEHSSRYVPVASALTAAGLAFCAFDLRGHGRSSGPRGDVEHWQQYRSDLQAFLARLSARFPGIPLLLYGHSLGAIIVLSLLQKATDPVQGAILSGTALQPAGVAAPFLAAFSRTLSWFRPSLQIPTRTPRRRVLSRDPAAEAAFRADPLVLRGVTARFGAEAFAMITHVRRRAPLVRTPLLGIHGANDPLAPVAGVTRFFRRAGTPDKRLVVYPDGLHEPHHDLDRDQVLADVRDWIHAHLRTAT